MRFNELYPGRYFNAEALIGGPRLLTISAVERQTLSDGTVKTVIRFENEAMQLIANLTNGQAIKALYGSDTDDWLGKQIELYPTTTPFGSKLVDCVRLRAPQRRQAGRKPVEPARPTAPAPAGAGEFNDDEGPTSADEMIF